MLPHRLAYGRWLIFVWFILPLQAQTLYSWVDERGIHYYSDSPPADLPTEQRNSTSPSSQQPASTTTPFVLPEPTTNLTVSTVTPQQTTPAISPSPRITLLVPLDGQVLRDNAGTIQIRAALTPPLAKDYQLRFILDGRLEQSVHNQLQMEITAIDRGQHQGQLELRTKDGTILAKSQQVTFYLHRKSILMVPARPQPRQ